MAFDLLGMGIAITISNTRNDAASSSFNDTVNFGAILLVPLAGALAGYYLFRRIPDDYISGSLINISSGHASLSLSSFSVNSVIALGTTKVAPTVSLLSVQF